MAQFSFTDLNSNIKNLSIEKGKPLFVVGANGSGKSSLMQHFYSQHPKIAKKIAAHRQTWFETNTSTITSTQRREVENGLRNHDGSHWSRWKDNYAHERANAAIFDLINAENIRARAIAEQIDSGALEAALSTHPNSDTPDIVKEALNFAEVEAPLRMLNDILKMANLPISIFMKNDEQILAKNHTSSPYSIAELSDGERNAILIGADILTAPPETIIIIDEPERHLHRSIISPLLSSLFRKRTDLTFVVSTHDVNLPLDNSEATTLLVRSCAWSNGEIVGWDTDTLCSSEKIDEYAKRNILGSRRKVLFIEGDNRSLDKQIYEILFPNISVIDKGSSTDVMRATQGIKSTESLTWIEAYGLIDADDRTAEELKDLQEKGVYGLGCYSVESLYYHPEIYSRLAAKQAEVLGVQQYELKSTAEAAVIISFCNQKSRLCARRVERKIKHKILQHLPSHKDILKKKSFEFPEYMQDYLTVEETQFDELVESKDIQGLILRYPLRETRVRSEIASKLKFQSPDYYEMAVRKLLTDDIDAQLSIKHLFGELEKALKPTAAPCFSSA